MENAMENKMVGLYIHVPYCVRKCPYCDFYSGEFGLGDFSSWNMRSMLQTTEYLYSVTRNISRYGERFNLKYDTVYFGGGTPSLLPEAAQMVLGYADIADNAEITFECNPETVTPEMLAVLKKAGVNRLSFGVQSLNDDELAALGRIHSAQTAVNAIQMAREMGFANISADIMLGIPLQTELSLQRTLEGLISLPLTHISAYMLKLEPKTPFGKAPPTIPDEESQANFYLQTVEFLQQNGFMQYEISNFSKKGYECRHNLKYWRCEEYVGIGPSAHSFYGGRRYAVPRDLDKFLNNDAQTEIPADDTPDLEPNSDKERLMLGLRLTEGVPLTERLKERLEYIPKHLYRTASGRLSLTPQGFLVSNEVIAILME